MGIQSHQVNVPLGLLLPVGKLLAFSSPTLQVELLLAVSDSSYYLQAI